MASHFLLFGFFAIIALVSLAYDDSPLQDFCVADLSNPVRVNGLVCKDPNLVQANDFFLRGLNTPSNTSNPFGFGTTAASVFQLPGLNTLGMTLFRLDFAPSGVFPPHAHPRAAEILTVLEGSLLVGFVTSYPENRLITKVLNNGDMFVIPQGLVHFAQNVGRGNVVGFAVQNSQNPGLISIPSGVFKTNPDIPIDLLAKSFQVDKHVIALLQRNRRK